MRAAALLRDAEAVGQAVGTSALLSAVFPAPVAVRGAVSSREQHDEDDDQDRAEADPDIFSDAYDIDEDNIR